MSGAADTSEGTGRAWWRQPLALGLLSLTLTAVYLALPARDSMQPAAALAVLLHIALGLLLLPFVGFHLWKSFRRHLRWFLLALLTASCAASGLYLFLRALFGQSVAHEGVVLWTHLVAGFAAIAALVWNTAQKRPRQATDTQKNTSGQAMTALLLSLCALGATTVVPGYQAETYYRDLTATNARQAENSLFPAGTRLAENGANEQKVADRWNRQSALYCGSSGCHTADYREWTASAHHDFHSDPFYQQVKAEYSARKGEEATLWCSGCHAPGLFEKALGGGRWTSATNNTASPSPRQSGTPTVQAPTPDTRHPTPYSVDCIACHATTGRPTQMGNGQLTLDVPEPYPFAGSAVPWQRRLHEFLIRVRPGPHQRAYLKPEIHRSAEFCASCHRQSFNTPQNGYQFVGGPDHFGEWQSGPYSGRSARTTQVDTPIKTCQDCHFPGNNNGHISHAAPGANTVLSLLNGSGDRLERTKAFLRRSGVTLDLFALRQENTGTGRLEQWLAPLEVPDPRFAIRLGETYVLDMVVSNRGIGHDFPSGYDDLKDAWMEVTLTDAGGRILLTNGTLPTPESPVPAEAHAYRSVPLDRAGNPIMYHNLTEQIAVAYRRSIPPGGSDVARYRLTLPKLGQDKKSFSGPLTLSARLRYRHLRPDFVRWAKTGIPLSRLPVTTLAEAAVTLPLAGDGPKSTSSQTAKPTSASSLSSPTWRRFVDYGNALLTPAERPEIDRAQRAFRMAQTLASERPEPFLGMGRAYLREPLLLPARTQFELALRLSPGHPAASAELATVYRKQANYERALSLLLPLAEHFPQDTDLLFDLGLTYLLSGSYEKAAEAFKRSLAADPDHAPSHYQLKNAFQRLRRIPEARREEAIGRTIAENRLAPQLRAAYLRTHPEEQRAAQPIPLHTLHAP